MPQTGTSRSNSKPLQRNALIQSIDMRKQSQAINYLHDRNLLAAAQLLLSGYRPLAFVIAHGLQMLAPIAMILDIPLGPHKPANALIQEEPTSADAPQNVGQDVEQVAHQSAMGQP